jgi:hypothetical protein
MASQIDIAPTLLGLLQFSYNSKFYGEDLLHDKDEVPHAFISNYQKVALIRDGELMVLEPQRKTVALSWPDQKHIEGKPAMLNDAIAYYQSASWWKQGYQGINTR